MRASRVARTALQAGRHAAARSVASEAVRPLAIVSQQAARAAAASPSWGRAGAFTSFAAASAAAAMTASASCEGTEPLSGLKSIRDAKEVVLYQYAVCPFCNKVRAFLDFHKIPYRVVEVNPLTKSEIGWSEYKKVPVLVVDGEQLNDSSVIMKVLTSKLPQKSGWGKGAPTPFKTAEEEQWFKWVDDRFVHVLTPNLYRTFAEAREAFDYITNEGNFGMLEREAARWAGAVMMYGISHTRLKKKHNIDDERKCLYETVGDFTAALGKRKFLGGEQPSLADVALFGMVRAVRGMETFADVMANTDLRPWFERMEGAVGASARVPETCNVA